MVNARTKTHAWVGVLGAALVAVAGAVAACSSADAPGLTGVSPVGSSGGGSCATPAAGCPCSGEGTTSACGSVVAQEGNHVECSEGTMTCKGGTWGSCVGETTHTVTPRLLEGLHLSNLPGSPAACTDSPCDPNCETYTDTPSGYDAGPGFVGSDAGVTLVGVVTHTTTCTGLTVTPATETLTVTQIPAATTDVYTGMTYTGSPVAVPATFTDAFLPASCYAGTPPTVWTVDDPTIATISTTGVVGLASPIATSFHVTAYSGGWTNSAAPSLVNVVVNAVDVSLAPSGYSNASFSGSSSTADNITVLYPYNNTVLPLGLPAPVIQWSNGGTSANAVRVQLRYPAGSGSLFTWSGIMPENETAPTPTLPGQPRAFPPQNVWSAFEQSAIGNTADIVIQRIVGGVLLKPNTPVNITFATGQLKGTVYYQSYGTNLVQNYSPTYTGGSFGGATLAITPGATAPVVAAGTNAQCVVCHSVSASGANLTTENGGNYALTDEYNLSTGVITAMSPSDARFSWAALSSDGSYLFSNSGNQPVGSGNTTLASNLYTVPGGTAITTTGLPSINAMTPSFSSDNAHVAFNFYGGTASGNTADQASLASIDQNPSTHAFSNFQMLATPGSSGVGASGNIIYYPSYLPSNDQLVWELQTVYNGRDAGGTRSQCDEAGPIVTSLAVTGATDANPIVITTASAHGLATGNVAIISGVLGNTAANGTYPITLQSGTVTGATNASPIVITTSSAHGLATGDSVTVAGVVGNTAANGTWTITVLTATTFSIPVAGNHKYTSGGTYVSTNTFTIPVAGNGTYTSGGNLEGGNACQDDGTHADIWWTDVTTKKSALLTNLNGGSYLPPHATALLPNGDNQLNYEPTVNPEYTGGYAWVVFTSRREYGNIATINPFWSDPRYENLSVQPTPKKLWVAAINPNATPGTDASYPAFYLPGQELLAGNSRGYWVLSQCEAAGPPTSANLCTSSLDCCPAALPTSPPVVCALDAPPATTAHCTSSPTTSCSANGAACTTSSQCCNFPSAVCAQNVCQPTATYTYSPSQFSVPYDGSQCPMGTRVSWIDVGLEALTPSSGGTSSSITIEIQAGNTTSSYTPSTPVTVGTLTGPPANQSATWNNFPLSSALASISAQAETDLHILVTFVLTPTVDKTATPTLVNWRARFDCTASE
jgi:hypothetical protein